MIYFICFVVEYCVIYFCYTCFDQLLVFKQTRVTKIASEHGSVRHLGNPHRGEKTLSKAVSRSYH